VSAAGWQQWTKGTTVEGTLVERARGTLGEMESTKQLVDLVKEAWQPGMRVLDVGCNAGHYLRGLRRLASDLDYVGVDAYSHYISAASEIYSGDEHARFEVKDIYEPLFPEDPFDIVYCCNVILHLPDFRAPLRNLLESTKKVCFVRTLLGDHTTKVRRAESPELGDDGEPLDFVFQNTWDRRLVTSFAADLGWNADLIEDRFDPKVLAKEFDSLKEGRGTRIVDGRQVDGVVLFEWEWLKFTPARA
jgi:SAM-dependent methyltransferase